MFLHNKISSQQGKRCLVIVLAAGEGKRMGSSLPKALHAIGGRSMLSHVLDAVSEAGADAIAVVVGPDREDVAAEAIKAAPGAKIFVQVDRRGTAHAVLAAREALREDFANVLVVFADTPLVRPETFAALLAMRERGAGVATLGFEPSDPTGYGRLLSDADGHLLAIREHKDASPEEREVGLCNAGLMALDGVKALKWLESVGNDNAQGEYYLPDVVEIARRDGASCSILCADAGEVLGVNDRAQLAEAEAEIHRRLRFSTSLSNAE